MIKNIKGKDVDISFVSSQIPWVMNSLYNQESLSSVTLEEIRDAFRLKQIQSKSWMMHEIKDFDKSSNVLVIGSWLGFTSLCLRKLGFSNITETDPDERLSVIAGHINRHWSNFVHLSKDVNDIDVENYDLIINTSCEHILNNTWFSRVAIGSKLVLHSNNLEGYDHVNICYSVEEMIKKYPMKLSYAGSLDLDTYKRFMLIGIKT